MPLHRRQPPVHLVLLGLLLCSGALGAAAAADGASAAAGAAAITRGQRLFSTGHSFHFGFPAILDAMAKSAGYADSAVVGISSIGGSQVIQHVGNKEAQAALANGTADVLMCTPIYLPDPGISQFAHVGAQGSPAFRMTVMEFWLPYDNYEPRNYTHGPAGSATEHVNPPKVDHDAATIPELRRIHLRYVAEMDDEVARVNAALGRTVVYVVPVGQAVISLRERIIAHQAPGLTRQWDLFSDELGHPKPPLTILMGWCHYAVIYRRSPLGLPAPKELQAGPASEALNRLLQELAWDAVCHHPLSGVRAPR